MNPSPKGPLPLTQLYELHFPRLVSIAVSEFHIAEDKAELLVHDLLLAHLFRPNPPADLESSLNAALRTAVQHFDEVRP
jgi:hypothetical protein